MPPSCDEQWCVRIRCALTRVPSGREVEFLKDSAGVMAIGLKRNRWEDRTVAIENHFEQMFLQMVREENRCGIVLMSRSEVGRDHKHPEYSS